MSFVMPEIMVQRVVQQGMKNLRDNPDAFNDIFGRFLCDELKSDYGQEYIDQIRTWFFETKIPVLQAWSLNADRIPCYSIHLAAESEDEQKAGINDYFGEDEESEILTGVFQVFVDVGIHADRSSNQVLWLYYILAYILFKEKLLAESLGMQLQTWSSTEYKKEAQYMGENIWSRWVRFKCTTQNFLDGDGKTEKDLEYNIEFDK